LSLKRGTMKLTRAQKEEILTNLNGLFSKNVLIASNYSSLKSDEITELRKVLKEKGIKAIVTKNTLVKKVLEQNKLNLDNAILDQPVIFAFGDDEVETSKTLYEFAKSHENLEILGGIVLGETADKPKILTLAQLPGRDELETKLVGILAGPSYSLANVLHANIRGLVSVIGQYASGKS